MEILRPRVLPSWLTLRLVSRSVWGRKMFVFTNFFVGAPAYWEVCTQIVLHVQFAWSMLIEGRGGRGSKLWFGKRRFVNIYVFFSLWIKKKKTSKYSKASAVKNLKLSSSMWSYHCKKFRVGESLKKKSYKFEGEEVPSPSLPPPPPPRPRTPLLDPPLSFFPIQRAFLIKCFFFKYISIECTLLLPTGHAV